MSFSFQRHHSITWVEQQQGEEESGSLPVSCITNLCASYCATCISHHGERQSECNLERTSLWNDGCCNWKKRRGHWIEEMIEGYTVSSWTTKGKKLTRREMRRTGLILTKRRCWRFTFAIISGLLVSEMLPPSLLLSCVATCNVSFLLISSPLLPVPCASLCLLYSVRRFWSKLKDHGSAEMDEETWDVGRENAITREEL